MSKKAEMMNSEGRKGKRDRETCIEIRTNSLVNVAEVDFINSHHGNRRDISPVSITLVRYVRSEISHFSRILFKIMLTRIFCVQVDNFDGIQIGEQNEIYRH